ncbi:redoxin domain-containing protein [Aquibacillus koreensis]|uniref:Redoxin domain-containing protein n=1 Tax=Aquibacillus koreensis TaxID=279446 RepID=A0A9X4AKJ9_9BACI|nr:redoxin domain-containing protein [Aquibacillus koreensis]MCT2536766.1 redoxin domain-containing protein [Aquibacillus koreensis]MDC3421478.1 redoxin domain-containing protein [Aquibacillus koreensis]
MKKMIIVFVLVGMFGYAIYALVAKSDNANSEKAQEEESAQVFTSVEESEETDTEQQGNPNETSEEKYENEGLEVGNLAPDFELETLAGETIKLSDFRGQNVMLNFWATWCPPCRAEMPDMQKFYENQDVAILAVNLAQTEGSMQDVEDFVKDFELTFPILLDEDLEVATNYAIRPIPTSYMIDSNGVIQYKAFGPMNYEMMVQELDNMN